MFWTGSSCIVALKIIIIIKNCGALSVPGISPVIFWGFFVQRVKSDFFFNSAEVQKGCTIANIRYRRGKKTTLSSESTT